MSENYARLDIEGFKVVGENGEERMQISDSHEKSVHNNCDFPEQNPDDFSLESVNYAMAGNKERYLFLVSARTHVKQAVQIIREGLYIHQIPFKDTYGVTMQSSDFHGMNSGTDIRSEGEGAFLMQYNKQFGEERNIGTPNDYSDLGLDDDSLKIIEEAGKYVDIGFGAIFDGTTTDEYTDQVNSWISQMHQACNNYDERNDQEMQRISGLLNDIFSLDEELTETYREDLRRFGFVIPTYSQIQEIFEIVSLVGADNGISISVEDLHKLSAYKGYRNILRKLSQTPKETKREREFLQSV